MRHHALCFLCLLLLSSVGWAETKRVTLSFQTADLVSVLETLAKEMGAYSYISPTTRGTVTLDLRELPAEEAVRQVLASQKGQYVFVLLEDVPVRAARTLVVATPEELVELLKCSAGIGPAAEITRMEFILEEAPAARVLDFLKTQYTDVEFTPHPFMNGFYARGPRSELLHIMRNIRNLDWSWCPPPPPDEPDN